LHDAPSFRQKARHSGRERQRANPESRGEELFEIPACALTRAGPE